MSTAGEAKKAEDRERVGQIVRVDANALLKTIRDLEYQLSEHHRQDKIPAWALAFETRISAIEKKLSNGTFALSDDKKAEGSGATSAGG